MMEIKEYLDKVAYIKPSEINFNDDVSDAYYSKFDDSYITLVGMEDNVKYLADKEITEELTHGVGFSPKDKKWYGWSHRAIYGFEIGSTCKKGDCHYTPKTPEDLIDEHAEFYADISEECAERKRAECQILPDRSGIRILTTPIKLPMATMENIVEDLENIGSLPEVNLFEDSCYVIECGKGEWTAKTMEDAKQMAADFNSGVS
jgi:hypothetical protein